MRLRATRGDARDRLREGGLRVPHKPGAGLREDRLCWTRSVAPQVPAVPAGRRPTEPVPVLTMAQGPAFSGMHLSPLVRKEAWTREQVEHLRQTLWVLGQDVSSAGHRTDRCSGMEDVHSGHKNVQFLGDSRPVKSGRGAPHSLLCSLSPLLTVGAMVQHGGASEQRRGHIVETSPASSGGLQEEGERKPAM